MDRFKNYDNEVRELVLDFEEMQRRRERHYFDVDQLTIIIDYYLEVFDNAQLERAVVFAEQLFPQNNEIRLRRSHLLCTKERYEEAYRILQELERQEPNNTDILYALGAVHSAMGNSKKAIQYFLKASADGYELGMVYGNIGEEYERLGLDREAISYYQRALEANAKEERSLHNLCDCYGYAHLEQQGINFFTSFVDKHPYSASGWYYLGFLYQGVKLFEKAIDAFEYATTIDPAYEDAYTGEAYCYAELGDIPHAIRTLHEGLEHVSDQASFNSLIAEYYMDMENYVTAIIYLKKVVDIDPSLGITWMSLARCYAMQDEYYAAVDCMERAFRESPNEPLLLLDAARIFAQFHEDEKAADYFEKGLAIVDYDDRSWTDYADFLLDRQQYDDAIEVLNRGLLKCESPLFFHLRLAECYYMTGRRNFLFNALHAIIQEDKSAALELLNVCPSMASDYEIMNILTSE